MNKLRGIHLGLGHDAGIDALIEELPALAEMGLNLLIPEVNYGFAYQSHPEYLFEIVILLISGCEIAAACL